MIGTTKIMSKSVDTPTNPYYIGVHIHECFNSKCRKNLTVLKKIEEISKLNFLLIYLNLLNFHLLNLTNIFSLEFYI
jgi:hypothetical protein